MAKQSLWEAVMYCVDRGMGIRAIARELGIHRGTVRKYMAADSAPTYSRHALRRTKLTPFLPYLLERWSSGCRNARHLYDELRVRGYSGKYTLVKDTVRPWRTTEATSPPPRRIELWPLLLPSHDKLDGGQQQDLDRILAANALLEQGYGLKEHFLRLVRDRSAGGLDQWLIDADNSGLKEFVALSKSFRTDYDAIKAGLGLRWSTAQCEGQITRVKLIKRLGYGRAKPDLLRQRVLHRSVA
jgi:transposase